MRKKIILNNFPARRNIVKALWEISKNKNPELDLKKIASELESLSLLFLDTNTANAYAALADLTRIIDTLLQWRISILEAKIDADRFIRSARERYSLWVSEYKDKPAANGLLIATSTLAKISSISEVSQIAHSVVLTPLPIGVFETERWVPPDGFKQPQNTQEEKLTDLTVAFLKFHIDGQPAIELQHIAPGEVHDLQIEVRVSRWPEDQAELQLTPISVEPKSTYDFPIFTFRKPSGGPPYIMQQRGRAIVFLPQGIHARPFEFKYMAEFYPEKGEQPVAVVGHRTLLIEGTDVSRFQVCGYPGLDHKLWEIRDTLRRRGGVPQDETTDALLLLGPLCNLAGRAVQDAEFPSFWLESDFQDRVRVELRRNPLIGSHLDEHAHAAGGITDLSLRGMPIELKATRTFLPTVDDCSGYFAQTASYAVAKGKRTAILCVLDCSPKAASPRPPESLLELRLHEESGVVICVLVIQGNLAKPSALSR